LHVLTGQPGDTLSRLRQLARAAAEGPRGSVATEGPRGSAAARGPGAAPRSAEP